MRWECLRSDGNQARREPGKELAKEQWGGGAKPGVQNAARRRVQRGGSIARCRALEAT